MYRLMRLMDENEGEEDRRGIIRALSWRGFGRAADILTVDVRGGELQSKGSGGIGGIAGTELSGSHTLSPERKPLTPPRTLVSWEPADSVLRDL